jgi:hypothetical protein
MKRYRLLKPLPYCDAGVIWMPENDDPQWYNFNGGQYWMHIYSNYMGNNPEFFEEILPESKDVFTWDGSDEGFLNYLIKQKEDAVKRHDFETASEWRIIERLYRSNLKIKLVEKPKGAFISLNEIVETYLKSEQSKHPSKPDTKEERIKGCGICGGELVMIRGKYPGYDNREVCPTCNTERLEQIQEISSPHYGETCKS